MKIIIIINTSRNGLNKSTNYIIGYNFILVY